ncbi:MAG: hypothetical protein GYB36_10455 [Alphaproteobacteria bacterium]|nr:hypothetical protein [Alphaproteobacteria bacterium]
MTKAIYRRSSIARPLEPQYKTNLAVMILAPIAGVAAYIHAGMQGETGLAPLFAALEAALLAFVAWAAARELDPDRNSGAFFAMALAVASLFFIPGLALWSLALGLMAVRVVNRSVGQPIKFGDVIIVSIISALAVFRDGFSEMGVVAAIAFSIDAFFDRKRTLNLIGAAIALSFTVWELIELQGDIEALLLDAISVMDPVHLYGALAILAALLGHALLIGKVRSVGDATGEPLSGLRVRAGVIIFALIGLAALTEGLPKALETAPVFAVALGVVIGRFIPEKRPT